VSGRTAYCARLGCCRGLAPYEPPRGLSSSLPRYREVLGYGLEPVTPYQHITVTPASLAARRDAYFTGPERTPAMTTTTRTEYGVRFVGGTRERRWPGHSSAEPGKIYVGATGYIDASDVDALHAAVAETNADPWLRNVALVSRTITTTEPVVVKPPVKLPTKFGSAIVATVAGERRVLVLADDDSLPWAADNNWHAEADLSDVEVLFDAATVTL